MSVDDLTIELTKIYYSLYRKREEETPEGTRNLASQSSGLDTRHAHKDARKHLLLLKNCS